MSTLEAQLLEKVSGGPIAAGRIHIMNEVFIVDIDQVLFYVSHIQQVQENIKARLWCECSECWPQPKGVTFLEILGHRL
jgi:hypothetical protein